MGAAFTVDAGRPEKPTLVSMTTTRMIREKFRG
jgi:hypothetical protein